MASQYLTFIIIFTLGISLVLVTNVMFISMSDQFKENVGAVEMDHILTLIQQQIQYNLLSTADSEQFIQLQLELPALLGQASRYTLQLTNNSANQVIIRGFTPDSTVNQQITFKIGTKYIIKCSGEFESGSPYLEMNYIRTDNILTITIS